MFLYAFFLLLSFIIAFEYYIREQKVSSHIVNNRSLTLFNGIFLCSMIFSIVTGWIYSFVSISFSLTYAHVLVAMLCAFFFRRKSMRWLKIPKKGDVVGALWNGSKIKGVFIRKEQRYIVVRDSAGDEYFCRRNYVWKSSHPH